MNRIRGEGGRFHSGSVKKRNYKKNNDDLDMNTRNALVSSVIKQF